jgi:hypothetical protein
MFQPSQVTAPGSCSSKLWSLMSLSLSLRCLITAVSPLPLPYLDYKGTVVVIGGDEEVCSAACQIEAFQ